MTERQSKYHAILLDEQGRSRAECRQAGIPFVKAWDSKRERARWARLLLAQRAGEIRDLRRQVRYRLEVNGQHICDYIADFVYEDLGELATIAEDVKGCRTAVYRLKRRLMYACYGIEIREV